MVAVFPDPDHQRPPLFSCLKPCKPAPEITDRSISSLSISDPFNQSERLSKRRRRWLSLAFGAAHAAAIGLGLGLGLLSLEQQQQPLIVTLPEKPTEQQAKDNLWHYLASDELTEALLANQERQVNETLAAAKQERLQAQQLRIKAEEQAERLTADATNRAQETTVDALRRAEIIRLDATYIGAEQVIYAEPGDDVTLKFAAQIQCKDGSFGETAIAMPTDPRIAPREVRNLSDCFPSAEAAAGQAIGEVGKWGVGFFKME